ncbi:jg4126 [Pararge aegeria aegeria]|uniref:Jg4126 protein n=1 Tax=Pararge aegeria aegeria TaxID=348720 RepID=A0A8S4RKX5_9NEOP|nr:jg4126 [Pararge aegeria aegeria]
MYADLTPQILEVFAQLSWRKKALFVLGLIHHWRFSVWSVLYAMSLYAKPVRSIADCDAARVNVETDSLVGSVGSSRDCWICYDSARPEPLITPCRCTGDVAAVHHDCLRRWLVESSRNTDGLKCKVCNTPYIVQETNK